MGTRCLTRVFDYDNIEILCMYRQCDGYPEGHGKELKKFLNRKIVNGYTLSAEKLQTKDTVFNGMMHLSAAMVAYFYPDTSIYLYPPGTKDVGEEFVYLVTGKEGNKPKIIVQNA